MPAFDLIAIIAASILVLWAAWQDFLTWKIRNGTVLALIAVYVVLAAANYLWRYRYSGTLPAGHLSLASDLGAALLLFAVGFALWLVRMLGAGDAKLFFPLGLFIGFHHLLLFAIILALAAVVVTLALKFRIPIQYHGLPYVARLEEIRSTGKVPYAVLMAAAALVAMYARYFSS